MRWLGFAAARGRGASAVVCAVRTNPRTGRLLQIANVIGMGLLVSACASSHAAYDGYSHVGAPNATKVAVAAPPPIELEEDGLAVQAPPRVRKNVEPDDPSEPFSPNYGPAPDGAEPAQTRVRRQRNAQRHPPNIRSRTTPMSPGESQAIIVQAMIAHERRNP